MRPEARSVFKPVTLKETTDCPPFIPFPGLVDANLMTIAAALIPRRWPVLRRMSEERLFVVSPESRVRAFCHWQVSRRSSPTLVILHGLEGSTDSPHVLGLASKAFRLGMNVVRMNMRNCGDTIELTPTLYNSGMSGDLLAVIRELRLKEGLGCMFVSGISMGGNIVLKAAAELGERGPELLSGICAISPAIDLEACVNALDSGFNRFYQWRFLESLKAMIRRKEKLFPGRFDLTGLPSVTTIRQFDDLYTAPDGGFVDAAAYYRQSSSLMVLDRICIPTLIVQARDDPFVPFASFESPRLQTEHITLITPDHGGHGAFLGRSRESPALLDRFWAENRAAMFCAGLAGNLA